MQSFFRNCLMLVATVGLISGCGGGGGVDRPDRTPVSGTVTFGGAPIADAIVVFSPAAEGSGKGATGITDAEGKFVLGTFEKSDGAVPGDYIVLVSKLEQEETDPQAGVTDEDPAYNGAPEMEPENAEPKNLVPAAFGKRASSTLKATVGADPVEGLEFDLGS